jgi:hypothetical protein
MGEGRGAGYYKKAKRIGMAAVQSFAVSHLYLMKANFFFFMRI